MVLRPLPLAAGALSRATALQTTLTRSPRPAARSANPSDREAQPRAYLRAQDAIARPLSASSSWRDAGQSGGLRKLSLWGSRWLPPAAARCMHPVGVVVGLGPPGRLVGGWTQLAHARVLRLAVIRCTRPYATMRERVCKRPC